MDQLGSRDGRPCVEKSLDVARTSACATRCASERKVAEREQRIVGVLAIDRVIAPTAVESAAIGPERIDEIEAGFAHRVEGRMQSGECVQRGRRGEKVGNGRVRERQESSLRMSPSKQPVGEAGGGSLAQMTEKQDGGGGAGGESSRRAGLVRIGAVQCAE